jgi:acetyltransferase-like isoleucine patch superfamily enzyme/GT2 family glycosyltransferase
MNVKTPIAIFAYNRPRHLHQLCDSLLQCARLQECQVYIFCDGVKKPEHESGVQAVREVAHEFASRLNDVHLVERKENLGLAQSVVSGVTDLCGRYGRVIVLEDDFVLHPFFLDFMLQSLDRYENDDRVAQVAGYLPPILQEVETDSFFLPFTSSCGWATWQRAWNLFSWDVNTALDLLESDPSLRTRFDIDGAYPCSEMLRLASTGKLDSWIILWYWPLFYHQKLMLYPHRSLVWVGGFDDLATNTKSGEIPKFYNQSLDTVLRGNWNNPITFPNAVQVNGIIYEEMKEFMRPQPPRTLPRTPLARMKEKLKHVLNRLVSVIKNQIDQLILKLFLRHEVIKERQRQEHFHRIATIASTATIAPEGVIENFLGDPRAVVVGEDTFLRGRLITYGHGGRIEIGKWCYLGVRSEIWSMDSIQIGDHVLIGHDVNIHDGTGHPSDAMQRRQHYKAILTTGHPRTWDEMPGVVSDPVVIEDDVSIGFGTTILQGVRIGARSIIAPGSMITQDVPPDVMYISTVKPTMMPLDLLAKMRTKQKDA